MGQQIGPLLRFVKFCLKNLGKAAIVFYRTTEGWVNIVAISAR
jgi:hypothetical protein